MAWNHEGHGDEGHDDHGVGLEVDGGVEVGVVVTIVSLAIAGDSFENILGIVLVGAADVGFSDVGRNDAGSAIFSGDLASSQICSRVTISVKIILCHS